MQIEKDINKLADLFESNLLDTNRGYNYYIDWSNIDGYKKYEINEKKVLDDALTERIVEAAKEYKSRI